MRKRLGRELDGFRWSDMRGNAVSEPFQYADGWQPSAVRTQTLLFGCAFFASRMCLDFSNIMNSEALASLFGTMVGAGISLLTTVWFQAVQKRAADRREFKSYRMELTLTISALNDCLLEHSALEKEVSDAEIDCVGRIALTPITHDFPVDQIEVAAARLPNLTSDYSLISSIRQVRLMLRVAQEKVRMTKAVTGHLGVDQGPGSAADTSLRLLREYLAGRALHGVLTLTSLRFSDAFLRSEGDLATFDEDHSIWKYMTGQD